MTPTPPASNDGARLTRFALAAALTLLAVRIAGLIASPVDLYADETQYWVWSRELDWGYFSKPPMIAWIIAATTGLFGDSDWAVRIAAPVLHTVTAGFLGLTAGRLVSREAGAWTAIAWLTLPSVWLSASIISTDAVLLAGWSAGLYALIRLREGGGWGWALMLGAAAGWGFLSKYAIVYFLLGLGLAAIVDGPARRALLSAKGLLALVVFALIAAPNVMWNAANEFATVSHTAANANWGADLIHPGEALTFLVDQLGVFGPVFFPALAIAIWAAIRRDAPLDDARPRLMLAGFAAPAILIVAGQAFLSRAHANWAASAYAAGLVLVVAFLLEGGKWRRRALYGSVALHTLAGVAFLAFAASPALAEAAGLANAFKRVRGWEDTAVRIEQAVDRTGAQAVAFDNRNDFHQMQRYGRGIDAEPYMWMRYGAPVSQAEHTWPLPAGLSGPILVASERPEEIPLLRGDFRGFEPAGDISVSLGGGRERRYALFLAEGYAPVPRTAAFEAGVATDRSTD